MLDIVVQTTSKQLEKSILNLLRIKITGTFRKVIKNIESKTQQLFMKKIMDSEEYKSLGSGDLRNEFGLPDGSARIARLMEISKNSIKAKGSSIYFSGDGLSGNISIVGIPLGFGDLLGSTDAKLVTPNYELPWLEWLLKLGDKIIVRDFVFVLRKTHKSRTGYGIMEQKKGSGWRVPPQFSGTETDNFVTRTIEDMLPELEQLIRAELLRSFR